MKEIIMFLFFITTVTLTSCDVIYKWQTEYPDNIIEEKIEDFIETQFEEKLDLTPFTGNKKAF